MGPSWRSAQWKILNASVYLYHDVIKLLNNWIFIQTAQADKRVRHKIIPREVMDDALRYVVSHEVGHCLGFMHNMSASSVIPVDSLRSPSFTETWYYYFYNGLCVLIMWHNPVIWAWGSYDASPLWAV